MCAHVFYTATTTTTKETQFIPVDIILFHYTDTRLENDRDRT